MATDVYLYWIQYGNIEIRVEASDAVGSSYGIVILIVKLSRQNGWEQKNHPSKMLILQEKKKTVTTQE